MSDDETPAPGTKAWLEQENERLRTELAAARAGQGAGSPARQTMGRPEFRGGTVLTEGERQDLALNGVVSSPFDGRPLFADDHDIDVVTEDGRKRLAAARAEGGEASREPIRGFDFVAPATADDVRAARTPDVQAAE